MRTTRSRAREAKPARAVVARVLRGRAATAERRFSGTFTIGRDAACGLQLLDPRVAPEHVKVIFDEVRWWARNLANEGTYLRGTEIQVMPLRGSVELEIGRGGPVVSLTVSGDERTTGAPAAASTAGGAGGAGAGGGFASEQELLERLRASGRPAGPQTQVLRRVVERMNRRSSRRYQVAIGAAVGILLCAGAVIWQQQRKLDRMRATAEGLFYATKTVELQTSRLEELVLLRADPEQVAALRQRRAKLRDMEREYERFVSELGVYAKASPEERLVLRVARAFGECEVNVPKGFTAEVLRYVARWKTTDRLAAALQRAKERGYADAIAKAFAARSLPPQYLYLALQESFFDERAVGPRTRYGYAKGMWQFISPTGHRYGLRIGPLYDERSYDPQDERFEWQKATAAAARYIRDLTDTEAQGSGLLVMASYNWGEHNIRGIIERLPESPRERNFWRLLTDRAVPRETYDYVLSIVSAAVLCEDPKLFGFSGECPGAAGRAAQRG